MRWLGPWPGVIALFVGTALAPRLALAQAAALERFEPAPAGDFLFVAADPEVSGELLPAAAVLLSLAERPLILRRAGEDVGDVVDRQIVGHVQLSLELARRLQIEADLPATLATSGEDPALGTRRFESPAGAALNDLRLGAKLGLFRQADAGAAAALSTSVWLPSGDDSAYAGSGDVRYAVALHVGADHTRWLWRGWTFRRFQPEAGPLLDSLGSDLGFGGGAALRISELAFGAELHGSTRESDSEPLFSPKTTPLEALGSVHYRAGPIQLRFGAGPGLTNAAGTPAFRVLGSAAFVPTASDLGQREAQTSALPNAGDDRRRAKPAAPDLDGDGLLDPKDRCPDRAGLPEQLGCPRDRDRDRIFDVDDRCPDVAGAPSAEPKAHGCPPDRDGDGITDALDACPREHGPSSADPKSNGCPELVRLRAGQIVLLQEVNFETANDRPDTASQRLLSQVARVMKEHPEIVRVAVDGHTDAIGDERDNLALSRRRAIAVVRWLVAAGIDERRLEARGFGPRRPLADNASEEGRAKNRRVEFQILERSQRGKEDWKDGPLHEQ